ncbi:hypothetical protein IC229_06725 [Spirosoma sp. BT702]|uniref:Periplasmic heavy metal sensor n=1 Tax=Spirosoma profusum TaxID=2771354 RepID=A0A927ARW1_9BACT|nr:hypothetical protein [Spirosoma profusum]MBD2700320.1 hypothetical protein [Spirosoma profusum]
MKSILTSTFFFIILCLLSVNQVFSQYYPGGGMGYGGGGYGRRMGGMDPTMSSSPRANIPNIAGDIAQKETKWLKENLSLTKDQLKAVKTLNNEYASQQQDAIKDIVGSSGKPGPETRKQIQDMMLMLNEEKEDKLKTILTPEQWETYQSKKEDMQKEVGGFRPPAPKKDSLSKSQP